LVDLAVWVVQVVLGSKGPPQLVLSLQEFLVLEGFQVPPEFLGSLALRVDVPESQLLFL
jgi:hypothetical protein